MAKGQIRTCWISGNKKEREATFQRIRSSFNPSEEYTYGDEISFDHLQEQVLQSDCFSARRIIVLKAFPTFTSTRQTFVNNFKKLLDAIPADCLVVFYGIDVGDEKAISTHVGKIGKIFEFSDYLPPSDAAEMVAQKLGELGKSIESAEALRLVQAMPSGDGKSFLIDQITTTAEKVACYMDRKKNITMDDVLAVAPLNEYVTPWQLFDAIDDKDFDKSVSLFRKLVICQGGNEPSQFVQKFIHLAMWRYKMLCFIRECQIAGMSEKEIVAETCGLTKLSSVEGTKAQMVLEVDKNPYSERQVLSVIQGGFAGSPLDKYTRKRLVSIVEFLQGSIEQTRMQRPDEALMLMMDIFLMLSCEKIDDNRRRALWRYFEDVKH